jgi:hypothetical protein
MESCMMACSRPRPSLGQAAAVFLFNFLSTVAPTATHFLNWFASLSLKLGFIASGLCFFEIDVCFGEPISDFVSCCPCCAADVRLWVMKFGCMLAEVNTRAYIAYHVPVLFCSSFTLPSMPLFAFPRGTVERNPILLQFATCSVSVEDVGCQLHCTPLWAVEVFAALADALMLLGCCFPFFRSKDSDAQCMQGALQVDGRISATSPF